MELSKKRQLTGVLIAGMALLACVFALHGSLLTRTIDFYGLTDASQGMPSAMTSEGGFIALISSLFLSGRISKLTLLKCGIGIFIYPSMDVRFRDFYCSMAWYWYRTWISGYAVILLYVRSVSGKIRQTYDVYSAFNLWNGLCNSASRIFLCTETDGK